MPASTGQVLSLWRGVVSPPPRPPQPVADIIAEVARERGLASAAICGRRLRPELIEARREIMVRAEAAGRGLSETGRALGGRNHATIFRGLQRHRARLAQREAQS